MERYICYKGKLWNDPCWQAECNLDDKGIALPIKCITNHLEPVWHILSKLDEMEKLIKNNKKD